MKHKVGKPSVNQRKKQTIFYWNLEMEGDGVLIKVYRRNGESNVVAVIKENGKMIKCLLTDNFKLIRGEDGFIKKSILERTEEDPSEEDPLSKWLDEFYKKISKEE
jgi:hypothetical protein